MKLIAYGGPETKYTKGNTRDSIILGLNTEFIDGIRLDIYITRDNVLVAVGPQGFERTGLTKEKLENTDYSTLTAHNIGNKVKHQGIIDLREVMSLYNNSNKVLVINLIESPGKESIMVNKVKELNNLYQNVNLYVETFSKEILDYLVSSNLNAKIGEVITNESLSFIDLNLDFYSFNYNELIDRLYNNNKDIFINQVNTSDALLDIYNKFSFMAEDFFIESTHVALINATYIINIKEKGLTSS